MTDWSRLAKVGQQKLISAIPRGSGEAGTCFAMKIKKVVWEDGKYCMDVVVRLPDLSVVLASKRWDVYPSMLPQDIQDCIDHDLCDDSWFIIELEENPNSKSTPKRTRFTLLDTQGGLAGMPGSPSPTPEQAGPSKPAASSPIVSLGEASHAGSERGQPQAGGLSQDAVDEIGIHYVHDEPPAALAGKEGTPFEGLSVEAPAACLHPDGSVNLRDTDDGKAFYCKDCGERVG